MKFFIDTANIEEIKKIKNQMVIDGVTTNPSLIAKTGKPIEKVIPEICEETAGPVSAEVIEVEEEKMFQEALKLSQLSDHVVVKVPLIPSGLNTARRLKQKGIKTNVTLCFSPLQALLAAKAGAEMVSIFAGRLDDIEQSGLQTVSDTLEIFSNYNIKSQVLAASIRHVQHILHSALVGADIVTAPYSVLSQLSSHPLTDIGLKKFLESAKKK